MIYFFVKIAIFLKITKNMKSGQTVFVQKITFSTPHFALTHIKIPRPVAAKPATTHNAGFHSKTFIISNE